MIAAIVPACGESRRMGRTKLLLPIDGVPLIRRVVVALVDGGVGRVVVVTTEERELAGAEEIARQAEIAGGHVVRLTPRARDMRESVEAGIHSLSNSEEPKHVMLTPGDAPGLTDVVVRRLVSECPRHPEAILVAGLDGRRGHPLLLPWGVALEIADLPETQGVNALLTRYADRLRIVEAGEPSVLRDLDTPEEYATWTGGSRAPDLPGSGPRL